MAPTNNGQTLFTCLSCSIAFTSADEQRIHYRSDFHRYNMKRRVASLPPVSQSIFDQKMSERAVEADRDTGSDISCQACSKSFSSQGAYQSHLNSKKHKENESRSAANPPKQRTAKAQPEPEKQDIVEGLKNASIQEETPEAEEALIEQKIAAAKEHLSSLHCLFCSTQSLSIDENLSHMSSAHSFFIPDADYLTNLEGLLNYLGEKIAIGNVCTFCNERGREFRSLEAVRKHMIDKVHCKIAYSTQADRLEISDYYDFSSSYPLGSRKRSKKLPDEEWEDADEEDDDQEVDEIVDEEASDASDDSLEEDDGQLTYGDSPFELVLPSGARIGHRSMRRYYAQSFRPIASGDAEEDPNSGRALVRRLLSDKNSALVPRKGGFGAYGQGTDVIKAKNRGEAREAGRHVKEFRDQKRREDFKTRIGFINNHQKHYRDPLLQ